MPDFDHKEMDKVMDNPETQGLPIIKKRGRPKHSKNIKRTIITIRGVLLSDLNKIFKENAVIPVDSRLFDLLAISPIDVGQFLSAIQLPEKPADNTTIIQEKVNFQIIDHNPPPNSI